jgi:tripartite ATP-independent transporter DctM subunit
MTDPQLALLMLGLFIFIILLGFPIAFTLMAMGVGFGYYAYFTPDQAFFDNRVFYLLTQNTFSVMNSDILVAIPLFLFMGYMIERSNILDRLFLSLQVAFRKVPGAMAIAALVTCALFATATGIVGAVVTLMGLLAFPAMLKARYDQSISAGVICAGGTLGILIPPSIMLIVYGATAGVSVVKLYAAALIPGFLLAGLYMAYVVVRAIISPNLMPRLPKDQASMPFIDVVLLLVKAFLPLAVLIMAVLGAILFGLATPSEAAAIGALGSVLLAIAYQAMTWQKLREAVYLTARTSAMVCYLFVGSWLFSSIFSYLGGESVVKDFVLGMNLTPVTFLLLTQLIIFLLGWPLEWSEIIIIFVPIFLPLLPHFGVDPIFFGILVALNLQTSFLTPPMAMSAYYLKGVAPKEVLLSTIFKGCLPFVSMVFVAMAAMYVFPAITTWLPDVLYGNR